jgi:hypothetical protein
MSGPDLQSVRKDWLEASPQIYEHTEEILLKVFMNSPTKPIYYIAGLPAMVAAMRNMLENWGEQSYVLQLRMQDAR